MDELPGGAEDRKCKGIEVWSRRIKYGEIKLCQAKYRLDGRFLGSRTTFALFTLSSVDGF